MTVVETTVKTNEKQTFLNYIVFSLICLLFIYKHIYSSFYYGTVDNASNEHLLIKFFVPI